jgi:hypothetical protein
VIAPPPVSPDDDILDVEEDEHQDIEFKEDVSEETRDPKLLQDPGAPTAAEVEKHCVTHMPYRSWCPVCVEGRARDKMHKKGDDQENKEIPEIVFDYGFLGAKGDEETIAVQIAKDRRTRMLFAHVVPRKGFAHEHGAAEMIRDIEKLGYSDVILKCDGEAALKSIQEVVRNRREKGKTVLENSPVGDSRANGAAERAVQSVSEQVRVIRRGLEQRLGLKLSCKHPVMTWLVEHSADLISKYQVGEDGKTAYERWKGKRFTMEEIEFGEKIHYRLNMKNKAQQEKLEVRYGEGFYMGRWWRTGEALVGTPEGVVRAGTVRRVGAHRRWDKEGLEKVQGVPWQMNPGEGAVHQDLQVRWLREEELEAGRAAAQDDDRKVYRMRLKREDFLEHGFTEGCPGCQALIGGTAARGHSEACRTRMEAAVTSTERGKKRRELQEDRENQEAARRMERDDKVKRVREGEPTSSSASAAASSQSMHAEADSSGSQGTVRKREEKEGDEDSWGSLVQRLRRTPTQGEKRPLQEDDGGMEISEVHRYQDDFEWNIGEVGVRSDMTEQEDPAVRQAVTDMQYFDENTWEELDPKLVEEGEKAELQRFRDMNVYEYVSRDQAINDEGGKFVKVKWVRVNKGTPRDPVVKCRLVAQELGYGQRMDELFSGTPSLLALRLALMHAVMGRGRRCLMILDVKCAFLYGECKRTIYIELPTQDPRYGTGVVGRLRKAMYGTRDAPQIWAGEVARVLTILGFERSVLQPSVYFHRVRQMIVIVHVDDFMCSGSELDCKWLYDSLKAQYDLKHTLLHPGSSEEARYLNRRVRWVGQEIEMEGDDKHVKVLQDEWGMTQCRPVDTPITKSQIEEINTGEPLKEEDSRKVRRAIARINYMAQDRPDLAVASRILSQGMSSPHEGIQGGIKRVIRYLKRCPRCVLRMSVDPERSLELLTDSDWAGDASSRRSCSGGFVLWHGVPLTCWSKLQSNVALSSGEAELNGAVKAMSEGLGALHLIKELVGEECRVSLCTDASACKGIVLRQGSGRIKHLDVKSLWIQGAVESHGVVVQKVPREVNPADMMTHAVSRGELERHLESVGYYIAT